MDENNLLSIIPLIEDGKTVRLIPHGVSMVPFIMGGRDIIELHKCDTTIKRGDIILYRRDSGILVLHRVYKVTNKGLFMLGDGQTEIEGPICFEQVVAMCNIYYKKGVRKDNNSIFMKFKYNLWFWLRPVRLVLIRANSVLKGI